VGGVTREGGKGSKSRKKVSQAAVGRGKLLSFNVENLGGKGVQQSKVGKRLIRGWHKEPQSPPSEKFFYTQGGVLAENRGKGEFLHQILLNTRKEEP